MSPLIAGVDTDRNIPGARPFIDAGPHPGRHHAASATPLLGIAPADELILNAGEDSDGAFTQRTTEIPRTQCCLQMYGVPTRDRLAACPPGRQAGTVALRLSAGRTLFGLPDGAVAHCPAGR